ncbi:acyltransferase family protein [Arcanobacterium pinnipediorum]|uniref:Acyltransferase n=1 Tax=Arcanobacterium pinnipediorum TaxID=1503041 RepID=A0ABY5AIB4_9ACTO|nr:acyltransferase family protein [Arcanobacterium pinnipediorum]USR79605.1 acyltransferase [Arcanobacterium pinnipediorum]
MEQKTPGRILGLDGLRAIAALIVVVYHLIPGVATVGYVGVDIFFVISGLLITSLLAKEFETNGSISLGAFWLRRIRRLVPAVVLATIGSLALARIFGGDALTQLRWQALGAVTGSYNWLQISHSSSYFDLQSPLLLNNMWSLAVEQQFYLFWPLVLIIFLYCLPMRFRVAATLLLAGASVALHVFTVSVDPTSAYVSTFSHSFGLMLGAGLALALPGLLSGSRAPAQPLWGYLSWIALGAILVLSFSVGDGWWMYPWGMLGFSILAVFVVRGLLPDASGFGARSVRAVLQWPPLVWLGHRSYGIYLWHWPLHVIGFYHSPFAVRPTAIVIVVLSIIFADLSYRFVETPIRRYGLRLWLSQKRHAHTSRLVYATGLGVLSVLAVAGILTERQMSSGERYLHMAQQEIQTRQHDDGDSPPSDPPAAGAQTESNVGGGKTEVLPPAPDASSAAPSPELGESRTQVAQLVGNNVIVIGDSVTVAAQPALENLLPGIIVDGAVSRSVKAFAAIAEQYQLRNELRPYVVIALGTNAAITAQDVESILTIVGEERKVVFVTASAPEYATWVPIANATMRSFAAQYPDRIVIADWEAIALSHPEYLAGDKIHPDSEGGQLFADAIVQALKQFSR